MWTRCRSCRHETTYAPSRNAKARIAHVNNFQVEVRSIAALYVILFCGKRAVLTFTWLRPGATILRSLGRRRLGMIPPILRVPQCDAQ